MLTVEQVFNLQTVISLVIFGTIAVWYVWPKLKTMSYYDMLAVLMIVAAFRYLGTFIWVPNMSDGVAPALTSFLGLGDLTVAIIALIGAYFMHAKKSFGLVFVWLYAILGTADFIYNGSRFGALNFATHVGSLMWMYTVCGPIWMVELVLIWKLLFKPVNK